MKPAYNTRNKRREAKEKWSFWLRSSRFSSKPSDTSFKMTCCSLCWLLFLKTCQVFRNLAGLTDLMTDQISLIFNCGTFAINKSKAVDSLQLPINTI